MIGIEGKVMILGRNRYMAARVLDLSYDNCFLRIFFFLGFSFGGKENTTVSCGEERGKKGTR